MKTIGLIYGNLSLGGIQRGASFQIPMFQAWGWRVVVMTYREPTAADYDIAGIGSRYCIGPEACHAISRADRLAELLAREHVDVIVHHFAYDAANLREDLLGAKRAGVPVVVFWHSVFSHFYLRRTQQLQARALFEACRQASAMITLTKTDECFFRMLGVPALAIPYSDADLMTGFRRTEHAKKLLWMGRFIELKRPLDAVRIFERVLSRHPDAELYMLGVPKEAKLAEDPTAYVASRPALSRAVHFEGFQKNVRPYLEQCGIGLVTSRFEGFCHAVVEMKMAGLPVVAYDMPYLDTLRPGSGVLTVPQQDMEAAAAAISALLDDPAECRRQGERARASYEELASVDQQAAYGNFFEKLGLGQLDEFRALDPQAARAVADTLVEHVDMALELMEGTVRDEWARCRSYRLGRAVTWPLRMLKRLCTSFR